MQHKNTGPFMGHIPDEELVRSADGELSPRHAAEVKAHLEGCWDCRARMEKVQSTMTGFVRAHHGELDPQLASEAGARALLRARLTELTSEVRTEWWKRAFYFRPVLRLGIACLCLIAIAMGTLWSRHASTWKRTSASLQVDAETAPNHTLTPGATRQVTMTEVCSTPQEEVVGSVSDSLRRRVLQEYGIANARPEDYEIDYLIAPGLGGTEDIRNLWPQPYRTRVWNARVKDALEERLHQMVCSGEVDLSTAQHDIAADWISAYKKYFHSNKPLPLSS
jgi:hypothetical protein